MLRRSARLALSAVLFSLSAALAGQGLARPEGASGFGPGENVLFMPATAFVLSTSSNSYFFSEPNHYLHRNLGDPGGLFFAAVDLPSGASVTSVCGMTYDNNTSARVDLTWEGLEMGSFDADPFRVEIASGTTNNLSSAGFGQTCLSLSRPTYIRKYEDLNGDGTFHPTSYFVTFFPSAVGASVGLGGVAIRWVRTVSPAPAVATFADVPTNFTFFRAIEAIASSGISGGCGGGNFCPNGNVTRGEMAAFFARALGLHEPDLPPAP